MSRWRIENDDGWFIVYKDGVEVASSENGDRMADVLNDAFHDANARIAELEAGVAELKRQLEIAVEHEITAKVRSGNCETIVWKRG